MGHLETIAIMRRDRGQMETGASYLPEIKFGHPPTDNIDDWKSDPPNYLNMLSGGIPPRPFTSAENDTIKAQAVKNLEEQRSKASKVFGLSPSIPAINQEVRRLKQTVKPGKVSFGDPQANTVATAETPPPAGKHAGRTIQDT